MSQNGRSTTLCHHLQTALHVIQKNHTSFSFTTSSSTTTHPQASRTFRRWWSLKLNHLDGICTHLCPLTQVWICMHPTNICSAFIHLFAIPRRTLCTCRRSLHRCSPRTRSCCHRSANRKPSSTQSVERPPTLLG